jgi:hypothetical protein
VHVVSKTALGFLVENEFIEWSARDQKYRPTKLAKACVASALSPEEGLVRPSLRYMPSTLQVYTYI